MITLYASLAELKPIACLEAMLLAYDSAERSPCP
jgi:hypothetical protein